VGEPVWYLYRGWDSPEHHGTPVTAGEDSTVRLKDREAEVTPTHFSYEKGESKNGIKITGFCPLRVHGTTPHLLKEDLALTRGGLKKRSK